MYLRSNGVGFTRGSVDSTLFLMPLPCLSDVAMAKVAWGLVFPRRGRAWNRPRAVKPG